MSRFAKAACGVVRSRYLASGLALVILTGSLAIWSRHSLAELKGPQPVDRQITNAVITNLKREHLLQHPLNDEISERWMKSYLKMLDPMKVYFTQADIDEFMIHNHDLDDMANNKDTSFGYAVFERLLKRIDERVKLIDELLAVPHDFTVDEDLITDPDKLAFAKNDVEAREIWRKRIKSDLLFLKSASDKEKVEGKAAQEKLSRRYHSFAKRMHQTDNDELLEMYLTALTTSYDPHTTYMSPDSVKNFNILMGLNLEGIGAALQNTDGFTVVSKIIPGGPAEKDGRLKPEDRIVGVGEGEQGEMLDVVDMKLNDVVKKIRGAAGTTVRLQVIPNGKVDRDTYAIKRDKIELSDSAARSQIFEEGKKLDGQPYKLGVIDLPSFYMDMEGAREGLEDFKSTTRDVSKLLESFKEQHVDAVIIDLRRNGGGSLTEAINLTGLFIDTGPVVQVKGSNGKIQHYDDQDKGMLWSGPLVVLTSKFSASASEIFAGAIQDYQRGLVVGDKSTHGKGTVQSLLDLGHQLFVRLPNAPELGSLKITMQQFYRPNGDSTQNRGVLADVELPSITSQLDVGESSLDYALKFDHIDPANYKKVGLVNSRILDQLRAASADRRKDSKDFDRVLKNIARYNEQKSRKRISLNEEKFLAERAEMNAEKEEEKEIEELNDPNRPVVKNDFYFKETMAITIDYLQMLKSAQATAIGQR